MRIIYEGVAGLDVHKKTVVATRMRVTAEKRVVWETANIKVSSVVSDVMGVSARVMLAESAAG